MIYYGVVKAVENRFVAILEMGDAEEQYMPTDWFDVTILLSGNSEITLPWRTSQPQVGQQVAVEVTLR